MGPQRFPGHFAEIEGLEDDLPHPVLAFLVGFGPLEGWILQDG
jgi:hypothetical protein